MNKFLGYYDSPIGLIEVMTDLDSVHEVHFVDQVQATTDQPPILTETLTQLEEYFTEKRTAFSVKLHLEGTEFQIKVWQTLSSIPYGTSLSYKDIATLVGNEKASRAVGNSNNKNRISILIPCHRVISSNQTLVGYRWGLSRKEWLLKHEKDNLN